MKAFSCLVALYFFTIVSGHKVFATNYSPISAPTSMASSQQDMSVQDLRDNHTYSKMSLEELEAIDKKTLTKSQKKLHRKALKAEKKRIKALKKRQAKYDKKLRKRERKIQSFVRSISVNKGDKFESGIQIYGESISKLKLFADYSKDVFLRAFIDDQHNVIIQLYVATNYDIPHADTNGQCYKTSPKWRQYNGINIAGGTQLPTQQINQTIKQCNDNFCTMREEIAGIIDINYLIQRAINYQPLEFKVKAQLGNDYVSSLSNEYIIAFLKVLLTEADNGDPLYKGALADLEHYSKTLGPDITRPGTPKAASNSIE